MVIVTKMNRMRMMGSSLLMMIVGGFVRGLGCTWGTFGVCPR